MKGDEIISEGFSKIKSIVIDPSGDEIDNKMKHSYAMINDIQVSPKMYNASIHSNKHGELFYAGFDIFGLILHYVKIDF